MKINIGLLVAGVALMLATACSKADYLTDEGVHSAKTPLNAYEFLKSHPWKSFDTLVMIIDHYNLQEELNSTGTMFVPTNRSVNLYMEYKRDQKQKIDENAKYTLDSLYKDITADSVRQYFYPDKLTVAALENEFPVGIKNKLGQQMAYRKVKQQGYNTTVTPVYFTYLIRVKGTIDDPNNPPLGSDPNFDQSVLCQTTGIETENGKGPILHVLTNKHQFVRY
ncbi:hypothetical protein MKQ68_14785 [Chitinophaga horti]|uniref:Fasciclin domain-containing protein n=1 Tax=Chitinophaga horti TaxID=2920382 RepID=A0ABY6IY67_9BACT|nr:hypothetical protein [Chitinophaga horti]UYQ91357.1 hypothetical protein MKQ68_14785 [Chitinophaga horti]